MMLFRALKANIETILSDAAAGRYRVVGHQHQNIAGDEVEGVLRLVQVYYGSGDFPNDKAGITTRTYHDIRFQITLTVAATAKGDLATLNDEAATAPQRAAALIAVATAGAEADASIDELFEIIYQILMDARNSDLGTVGPPFVAFDRWVPSMQKDAAPRQGEHVILTGVVDFTCRAVETVDGDTPTPVGSGPFDQELDIDGDDTEQTGVTV